MCVTGLVLAGGRGTRMNKADKGLQVFRGERLIDRATKRLAPQVAEVMISANRNFDVYQTLGVPVWHDEIPDFAGPLAGIHAGLMHCPCPYLAVVPCDSPFFPEDLVMRLETALEAANADLAFAVTGDSRERRVHPVFCLLKASLLPDLTLFLQGGGRKMQTWFTGLKTAEAHFPDESAFRNFNTLQDLRDFAIAQERMPHETSDPSATA